MIKAKVEPTILAMTTITSLAQLAVVGVIRLMAVHTGLWCLMIGLLRLVAGLAGSVTVAAT